MYQVEPNSPSIPPVPDHLPDPDFSESALIILRKRYLAKDRDGQPVETPREMLWRVAYTVAYQEWYYPQSPWWGLSMTLAEEFYHLMAKRIFLPNSPTLMNAGRPLGQLAACFVLPIDDSMDGIFDAVKNAALIHKSGGGTGFSFSRLRPEGSTVGSTGGVASGPVSFLKIFDTATEQVKQGGTRRGANMGVLRVDHPDIEAWIRAKEEDGTIANFNLSVGITDEFMRAVQENGQFPLIAPHTGKEVGRLDARTLFNDICKRAHANGEPGVLFLDTINRHNTLLEMEEIESTNPCGEEPLLPYEACNLGSINLSRINPESANWIETVGMCIRFLDNVIDASNYPLPQITEAVRRSRKIGLGIMGWADYLFQQGAAYGSPESFQHAEAVAANLRQLAEEHSYILCQERGPYPAAQEFSDLPWRRNADCITQAPTGTLSMLAGCSSGIEPVFALSQTKTCLDGTRFTEVNPVFEEQVARLFDAQTAGLIGYDVARSGSLESVQHDSRLQLAHFVIARDVTAWDHITMQATFQEYAHAGVSKTINLPSGAAVQDVYSAYVMAWEMGCKGVTVYRDGSRRDQVYTRGQGEERDQRSEVRDQGESSAQQRADIRAQDQFSQVSASDLAGDPSLQVPLPGQGGDRGGSPHLPRKKPRPDIISGFTQRVQTGLGKLYLTVNELEGRPFEVFATIGQSGKSPTAKAEAVGRLVSLCLRSEIPVADVVAQLEGIGGDYPNFSNGRLHKSIPDAIGWILRTRYLQCEHSPAPDIQGRACPECGAELIMQEGCFLCSSCGYTKCG